MCRMPVREGWGTRAVNLPLYSADGLRWRVADELVSGAGKTLSANIHLVTDVEGAGLYRWQGMYYLSGQGQGSPARGALWEAHRDLPLPRPHPLVPIPRPWASPGKASSRGRPLWRDLLPTSRPMKVPASGTGAMCSSASPGSGMEPRTGRAWFTPGISGQQRWPPLPRAPPRLLLRGAG